MFFETTKLLKEFYNSPYMDIYRNNNELRIMTEEVNPYEKMSIIRQATSPSKDLKIKTIFQFININF